MTTPIPQPPAVPFLGNIANVESEVPVRSHLLLAKQYGEIYQLNVLGKIFLMVNSYDLVAEVSDDTRFKKVPAGPLKEVRRAAGDGLFTLVLSCVCIHSSDATG
jgi:cytochrome P450/NADPH-cytochrome P450 reductase